MPRITRRKLLQDMAFAAAAATGLECLAGKQPLSAGQNASPDMLFPPQLPGGQVWAQIETDELVRPSVPLRKGVEVARTPPRVEFAFFPGQTYRGNPWSNWADGTAASGKYYTAIGDHLAPAGNAWIYEVDALAHTFRPLLELRKLLDLPEGHYTPGKIHTRVELGRDGWLYAATHRGSTTATREAYHYRGDWIVRCDPRTGAAEVVAHAPVAGHCIPCGRLDPQRLVFYGGTTPGSSRGEEGGWFFAYDCAQRRLLYAGPGGPARALIVASTTGRAYFVPGSGTGPLHRFDPAQARPPEPLAGPPIGVRAATEETPQGVVYTVSSGQGAGAVAMLAAFDVRRESVQTLGPAAVASQQYIAALAADPTGRYVYYVPGAHGGSDQDGSPVVQFDVPSRTAKVLAFLHPVCQRQLGIVPRGSYGLACDPTGQRLYVTWNVSRGGRAWDVCGVSVLHIPPEERPG